MPNGESNTGGMADQKAAEKQGIKTMNSPGAKGGKNVVGKNKMLQGRPVKAKASAGGGAGKKKRKAG